MDICKVTLKVLVGEFEVGDEIGDDFWVNMRGG